MKIPATIGVLTYNSAENLARCLASVKDFAEIVVADGGSTDATLEIARVAGAHIISQSNPGHAITDFSRERNLMLSVATQPWFFYLDTDEIMSPELVEHIRNIASDPSHPYGAYRVRYLKTNAEASKIYRTYKEYYQVRLARTDVGAHLERPMHERIEVPLGVKVGQTEAPWYVPLQHDDVDLRLFARKVWRRTEVEVAHDTSHSVVHLLQAIVFVPLLRTGKSLLKIILVKIRWGSQAIPMRYELLRILAHWISSVQHVRRLLHD